MTALDLVLDVALVVLLVVALLVAHRLLRDVRALPTATTAEEEARVSAVVPARDEEATLPALLASLRASSVPLREVVVVDDGSRDATAAVARAGGARVLAAGTPPEGWTGKAWACDVGARATSGDLLLFLDADTVLGPDALAGLLALHRQHGGLVSVQPWHRVVRAYEQLSAYFNVVALLASGAFARRPARRPMAIGPCLLTSRVDHERVGGHATVRAEILDDVRLAHAYHRAGLAVTSAVGGTSVWMRSYPGGLRQLVAGWTKNFASGASAADPRAMLGTVVWLCAHHAVAVGALLSVAEAVTGRGGSLAAGAPALWAVGWVAVAAQLRALLRTAGSFRWWTWALFPLPLLAFDLVFARSAALTAVRRSVRWRGRDVDLRQPAPSGSEPGEGMA